MVLSGVSDIIEPNKNLGLKLFWPVLNPVVFLSFFLRASSMAWQQRIVRLAPRSRGFHLITHELEQALTHMEKPRIGLLHLFLQHTSASLSINENADPDVPYDLEMAFRKVAPEEVPYRHTCEGPDDMPAHIKTSMLGCSLTIPVEAGKLCLGTWQGVYLCEHRIRGGSRNVVLTLHG